MSWASKKPRVFGNRTLDPTRERSTMIERKAHIAESLLDVLDAMADNDADREDLRFELLNRLEARMYNGDEEESESRPKGR
ncbi:hypothetical protein PBI_CATDAWG_110 [Mycobacterium phage Catdawg]|uniref:Uncharacterized protein n=1 Tax=Mycobacterium phage Catdawg TaxID=1340819 RepID=S5Z3W3_9CAUD|nr:hypothetical protein PBI_CATDAWG_110 [Mycobacterium phage Catdawg]AGT12081.1 hypothetical protein PBI_CATDAWG_110 [Mycobacterium phage Catdawg]QFP97157.1 hypothetical protein SEA_KRILI_111 [Mycobacterium phage Krili]